MAFPVCDAGVEVGEGACVVLGGDGGGVEVGHGRKWREMMVWVCDCSVLGWDDGVGSGYGGFTL